MRKVARWFFIALLCLHGVIHLVGVVEPDSRASEVGWLLGAVILLTAAGLLAARVSWWWQVAAVAALTSQVLVMTDWSEARAGTLVNAVVLLGAARGFASGGSRSLRTEYQRRARQALARPPVSGTVQDADLAALPPAVAAYVAQSGAVGLPPVESFRARIHGRIRAGRDEPWMSFTGEQVNTYGSDPQRLFFMDATMRGLPVDVFHTFTAEAATMRVRLCSMLPMVDTEGDELTRAETVTVLNDLCVLAPAALLGAAVTWRELDDHRVVGTLTHGAHTVSAELVFDDDHRLVDFVSDDRLRSAQDGKSFRRQRWSTPIRAYSAFDGRRVASRAEAWWHDGVTPEGFCYLEIHVDDLRYNAGHSTRPGTRPLTRAAEQRPRV